MHELYKNWHAQIARTLVLGMFGFILIRTCIEFYNVAWGTGVWLGELSLKWSAGFTIFALFCLLSWVTAIFIIWKRDSLAGWEKRIVSFRKKLGPVRWLVVLVVLVIPSGFCNIRPGG